MVTETWSVNPESPDTESIARAAEQLRSGNLVAFPTETVYGLGANALDAVAVERIFIAKGRPTRNPVIVHVIDAEAAREVAADWPNEADLLAERFWPGPLTLILSRRKEIPDIVTGGGPTVGVRVPAHPVALALLRAAGIPIAAPSANRSLQLSPTLAAHVAQSLGGRIPFILDGGPTSGGLESTVVRLGDGQPLLLRPGLLSPAEIEAVIGPLLRHTAHAPSNQEDPLPAPGMMSRHYAPSAPLEIHEDGSDRVYRLLESGVSVGWLTCKHDMPVIPGLFIRQLPDDAAGYASRLYAALHELDACNVSHIVVDMPPPSEDWLAVRDRLTRAAATEDNF